MTRVYAKPNLADSCRCTGCAACETTCPSGAIAMVADGEGFLHHAVDSTRCVGCGRCETVCPPLNLRQVCNPQGVFAARAREESVVAHSSSGGVFRVLADWVMRSGGVVIGCVWKDNFRRAVLSMADDTPEVVAMMGSKYVKSETGSAYRHALGALNAGRLVLFTGTPCQIAGLTHLVPPTLRERLMAVEIVCHGGPSPAVWRQYLGTLRKRLGDPAAIGFRDKRVSWERFSFVWRSTDGVETAWDAHRDPYLKAFFRALSLRPCCACCPAKAGRSGADLTLGDLWGVETLCPDLNDGRGASSVVVWTPRGESAVRCCVQDLTTVPIDWKVAIAHNFNLVRPTPHHEARAWFMAHYATFGVRLAERLCKPSKAWLRRLLACFIRERTP